MATGKPTLYDAALLDLLDGTFDWITDDHCAVRLTSSYTPDASAHTTYADISAYETGTNADMSGEAASQSSGVTKLAASNCTFSGAATCRYVAIVQSTVAGLAAGSKLVGYVLVDDTPADVSLTSIAWNDGGIFRFQAGTTVATGAFAPYGLTEDQYSNQSTFFAWRAQEELMLGQLVEGTTRADGYAWPDSANVRYAIDASNNMHAAYNRSGAGFPKWKTTTDSDATQALRFDPSNSRNLILSESITRDAVSFLYDDTSDFTVIMRVAFMTLPGTTGTDQFFLGNLSGSTGGMSALGVTDDTGNNLLQWGVRSTGQSYETVSYTWSLSADTMYTIAVTHSAGGVTTMYVDDFSSSVASGTLGSWQDLAPPYPYYIGCRGLIADEFNGELGGIVLAKKVLTQSEIEAWDTWIQAKSG